MLRLRQYAKVAGFAPLALACSSTPSTAGPTTPTLVAVSPTDFAGDVPCTDAPGAMRSYVVTLYDLGTWAEPTTAVALPSSVLRDEAGAFRPTPCERTAAFALVVPGHRYDAEVDAYDRTDLVAVGPGSRLLLDDATGEYVTPRWTTTCGRKADGSPAEGPVTAQEYLTRFVRGCEPMTSSSPDTPTGIRVTLADALGALGCGDGAGEVSSFSVSRDASLEPPSTAACGASVDFTELEPGKSYTFSVLAFESAALTPRWSTSCYRTAAQGALLTAACDPLVELAP